MGSKTTSQASQKPSGLTLALFVLYALLLVGVILFKLPFQVEGSERAVNFIPLAGSFTGDGALRIAEVIENILIFIPLGVYLCMLKIKWTFAKKFLLVVGVTVGFEIIQFVFAMGKSDVTDILGNTLGGVIGIGAYAAVNKVFKANTNKLVNIVALGLILCVIAFFALLLFRR